MKRLSMILGILVLAGAVAVPVMAFGPDWGWGHHMMGYWDNSPGYSRSYGNLTSDQQTKLNALDQKYYDETRELRNQIWSKSGELDAVLNSSAPDLSKAKALQNEISGLRAKLDEKTVAYEFEARKIAPEQGSGYGYGYGRHMMGPYYGRGMAYGPGYCWN